MTQTATLSHVPDPAPVGSRVWLAAISHGHGDDTSVHATEDGAKAAVYSYVVQFWHEVADKHGLIPSDPDQAVQAYFDEQEDRESYGITAFDVES